MDFTHHSNEPVDLAMALVNTDQRSIGGEDEIGDVVSLNVFAKGLQGHMGWSRPAANTGRTSCYPSASGRPPGCFLSER